MENKVRRAKSMERSAGRSRVYTRIPQPLHPLLLDPHRLKFSTVTSLPDFAFQPLDRAKGIPYYCRRQRIERACNRCSSKKV